MLEKKYFLTITGVFDRDPIEYDYYPSNDEITDAIVEFNGTSAKVEERFVLINSERMTIKR